MESAQAAERFYQGPGGYAWAARVEHGGKTGALLYYANPDPRKLHVIDDTGMSELAAGVDAVAVAKGLDFCIFHGAYDPVHAGADITQFADEPDFEAIKRHLYRGTALDTHVKSLSRRMRTVAIIAGDRYGGSVEWPLFAEWTVAAGQARLQFSEVHLGIVPGWNGILNALLKSGAANALYMGQTGNPVDAGQLERVGLAQRVVATPAPPDRRATPKEEWPAVWAAHAEESRELLLNEALELATQADPPVREAGIMLATEEELAAEVARRTDPAPYRELRGMIQGKLKALGAEPEPDALKALGKEANRELGKLGKPLAPQAVEAVAAFVGRWGALAPGELTARFDEAGHHEADLCDELMRTEHRKIGVAAVLTRNPALRIPVFD